MHEDMHTQIKRLATKQTNRITSNVSVVKRIKRGCGNESARGEEVAASREQSWKDSEDRMCTVQVPSSKPAESRKGSRAGRTVECGVL